MRADGRRSINYLAANFIRTFGAGWYDKWTTITLGELRRLGIQHRSPTGRTGKSPGCCAFLTCGRSRGASAPRRSSTAIFPMSSIRAGTPMRPASVSNSPPRATIRR